MTQEFRNKQQVQPASSDTRQVGMAGRGGLAGGRAAAGVATGAPRGESHCPTARGALTSRGQDHVTADRCCHEAPGKVHDLRKGWAPPAYMTPASEPHRPPLLPPHTAQRPPPQAHSCCLP
ncbi:hypothetical protein E2C01_060972 [Portunus trituberculatus]|uniref:Uncharacterized protein n=1 Tax=Portunus trituberculatus TaxID=210409 RepID=A0A5B7HAI2_PORTR|nr:hypothetical protein [Portunus trituberculatus]